LTGVASLVAQLPLRPEREFPRRNAGALRPLRGDSSAASPIQRSSGCRRFVATARTYASCLRPRAAA